MEVYIAALVVTGASVLCGRFLVNECFKQPHY
jgi:hypothetical protein